MAPIPLWEKVKIILAAYKAPRDLPLPDCPLPHLLPVSLWSLPSSLPGSWRLLIPGSLPDQGICSFYQACSFPQMLAWFVPSPVSVFTHFPRSKWRFPWSLYLFIYLFIASLLEYNCFTMVCQFLLYNKVSQLYIYIYRHISSLLHLPPTLPIPSL